MTQPQFLAIAASHAPGMNMPEHRDSGMVFRGGIAEAAELVRDFDPDLVVCFGSDHRRAFREIIPTFSVVWDADGLGDYDSPTGDYDVPTDVALRLTNELVASEFDVAVATGVTLDHGFGQTIDQLLGSLRAKPVIPLFINCATEPLPTVARTIAFGTAIGRFCAGLDQKVLFVGSGGMSHTPPSLDRDTRLLSDEYRRELAMKNMANAQTLVLPDWDRDLLKALSGTEEDVVATVTDEFLEAGGTGAHEIRNWLAVWAAAGRRPLREIAYEPISAWVTGMGVVTSAT